jgi:multidrug efflux pump
MPLGLVIVGGIMFSLILTLFVIPAMYSFLSSSKQKSKLDETVTVKVDA